MTMLLRNMVRTYLRPSMIGQTWKSFDQILCLDIECTCDSPVQIHPMEIIEIACIKLDLNKTKPFNDSIQTSHMFHSYVKPVINPELTLFCQELTGIMQSTVEKADDINIVLKNFLKWLKDSSLIDENLEKNKEFAFATCGNFDLINIYPLFEDYLLKNDQIKNESNNHNQIPIYFKEWINVKRTFVNHKREWPKTLYNMMALLGEEPSGRLHSAKDDCRNLARVVECLHQNGCKFYVTNRMKRNIVM